MVAQQSGTRTKGRDPVAWVRYDDGLAQEFPLDRLRLADFRHSVPRRQVRSRHGEAHYSGVYASATTGGFVVYESRLELARLLADFDARVFGIYAQPCLVTAVISRQARRHVPDFLLAVSPGVARVVNVKPAGLLKVPLQQELDRDGGPGCRFSQGRMARQAEHGGGDPRLGRRQRHAGRGAHGYTQNPVGCPHRSSQVPARRPGRLAAQGRPAPRGPRCRSRSAGRRTGSNKAGQPARDHQRGVRQGSRAGSITAFGK
jgi:hypothetical protein